MDKKGIVPVFLISLPRSGSTMLQRILMNHPKISSLAEPWFLLPQMYVLRSQGLLSEYNQRDTYYAMKEFIEQLPNGLEDYYSSIHDFAISIYQKQSDPGAVYFLDKTPRYHLIIKELSEAFPEAKFIFLVRNPIQTIASMISTFALKDMHFYEIDLKKGFQNIAQGMISLQHRSITVDYDDIVHNKDHTLGKIMDYLGLEFEPGLFRSLNDKINHSKFGDKVGIMSNEVSANSSTKWHTMITDGVIKKYITRTLEEIDAGELATYGYNKEELLNSIPKKSWRLSRAMIYNQYKLTRSKLIKRYHLNLYRKRNRKWIKDSIIN